ncbi:MAG: hypothetical protein PF637_03590 [Spirochaetes bacterium]|jgi:hypothetical protein|nr:hypothetical protein [Spirochaetota bacterium]
MDNDFITDLTLEQYLLHELPEETYNNLKNIIESDVQTRLRLLKIEESNHDFFSANPVALRVKQIEKAAEDSNVKKALISKRHLSLFSQFFNFKTVLSFSSALAIVMALFMFMPRDSRQTLQNLGENSEVTRIKGSASLNIYKKSETGVIVLTNRSVVKPGDHLQIAYQNDTSTFGAILSIDGNGTITRHFPIDSNVSRSIEKGKRVTLDNSYVLDDAPYFEKFYLFISKKPFQIKSIENRLQETSGNNPESEPYVDDFNIQFKSFILYKE